MSKKRSKVKLPKTEVFPQPRCCARDPRALVEKLISTTLLSAALVFDVGQRPELRIKAGSLTASIWPRNLLFDFLSVTISFYHQLT